MAVRRQTSGKWLAEIYPEGRPSKVNPNAPRIRKQFATKGEALAGEIFLMVRNNHCPSESADAWFQLRGKTLGSVTNRQGGRRVFCAPLRGLMRALPPVVRPLPLRRGSADECAKRHGHAQSPQSR